MKAFAVLVLSAFLIAPSCTVGPDPVPPPQPDPGGGSCELMCENLKSLGCEEWAATCVDDCHIADRALQDQGIAPSGHACASNAASCETVRACS